VFHDDGPSSPLVVIMVVVAGEGQVVQVGVAAVAPRDHVMCLTRAPVPQRGVVGRSAESRTDATLTYFLDLADGAVTSPAFTPGGRQPPLRGRTPRADWRPHRLIVGRPGPGRSGGSAHGHQHKNRRYRVAIVSLCAARID
jgi:hypothetical protein